MFSAKSAKGILFFSLFLMLVLGTAFYIVLNIYKSNPVNEIYKTTGNKIYSQGMLFAKNEAGDGDDTLLKADAIYYNINSGGGFYNVSPINVDMSSFGIEGGRLDYFRFVNDTKTWLFTRCFSDSAFTYDDTLMSLYADYDLVYCAPDGRKYITNDGGKGTFSSVSPLMKGCVNITDIYGEKISAISPDGFTAAGITGEVLNIEFRSAKQSDELSGEKAFILADYKLNNAKLIRFINNRCILIFAVDTQGKQGYHVFDAVKGEMAACQVPEDTEATQVVYADYYQAYHKKADAKDEKYIYSRFFNVVLGTEYAVKLDRKQYESAELCAVSPNAERVLITAKKDGKTVTVCSNVNKNNMNGRQLVLDEYFGLTDAESYSDIYFLHDNVIWVNFNGAEGKTSKAYKLNF
ncbi:MAG: hypothetical protein VB118_10420 [Oscillospiraceae bacterium]|nr:hypothetical protein [Oscillospiraceae bacterium]